MDSALIPEGVERCSLKRFTLGLVIPAALVIWGLYAAYLCWFKGLNQTNMNDSYGFALWIWADLAVIAVGGGAFFTGFLRYVVGKDELKNIINFAVIVGFCCYCSAMLILAIDIGQPLRGWFIFWHANVHSMLTEVAFCLSLYLSVLAIEYLPLVLENRKIDQNPFFHNLGHRMHEIMAVFAATGAFLSCFHQGSLGGVTGVLYGRPFGLRDGIFIWPWTFFLYTWSAAACGPCFTMLCCKITEKITGKKLVKDNVYDLLAKISGWMLGTYMVAKIADTIWWAVVTVPKTGFSFMEFYTNSNNYHGFWILILELVICGIVPAAILLKKEWRQNSKLFMAAVTLAVIGVCVNRWVMVMQPMAMPVMTFDSWVLYFPSWQEWATTILPVAGAILIIALSYRYLPVFPQEKELNPVEKP
ncbi:menaquinone reductase integral membrane subunit QrcD [Desulfoluna spongiiphila]|uniref:Prokaryotic molybdopterin-containing oxidoreductase family, membrane subunit n=1 Tax=Desulfoluna spongiiphila TaxID=419481 RepID=A0A1G5BPT6_9BACT|nr:menaquinone reductase integral membrane subunit QrcD [Desulfoluna spongiiphila]SCX92044.1 prokaryotic molybdopterin-containing oxidoreductase family, membrane subunit [Desulfoluna spongiiphila]VVS93845.1 nrfd family [Desulfoluna spongiiphila]